MWDLILSPFIRGKVYAYRVTNHTTRSVCSCLDDDVCAFERRKNYKISFNSLCNLLLINGATKECCVFVPYNIFFSPLSFYFCLVHFFFVLVFFLHYFFFIFATHFVAAFLLLSVYLPVGLRPLFIYHQIFRNCFFPFRSDSFLSRSSTYFRFSTVFCGIVDNDFGTFVKSYFVYWWLMGRKNERH